MTRLLLGLALATLSTIADPAAALGEPIKWTWNVEVAGEYGSSVLDLGSHRVFERDGSVVTVYATKTLPVGSDTGIGIGDENQITLIVFDGQSYELSDAPPAPVADEQFRIRFAVTDQDSGETGAVEFLNRVEL